MIKNALIIEKATEIKSLGRARKLNPADLTDFAQLLGSREVQSVGHGLFGSPERSESRVVSRTQSDSRTEPVQKDSSRDSSVKSPVERSKDIGRSQSGNESGDARGPLHTSESGQTQQGYSADSVDGCENGVQPGTSTEATVNANNQGQSQGQTSPDGSDRQADKSTQAAGSADSEAGRPGEVQEVLDELLSQMTAATSGLTSDMATGVNAKIGVQNIESANPMFAPNLNLPEQAILFESSLAEHFIRVLTDRFSQVKSGSQGEDSNAAIQSVTLNPTSGQTSKGIAEGLSQTPQLSVPDDSKATDSMNRILQVIRSNLGRRQSQMTVQLDPPELGKLRLDVKLVDNDLSLFVTTETAEARHVKLNRDDSRRAALEHSGIAMSKFEVVAKSPDTQSNQNWQSPQDQPQGGGGGFQHSGSNGSGSGQHFGTGSESADDTNDQVMTISRASSPSTAMNLVA